MTPTPTTNPTAGDANLRRIRSPFAVLAGTSLDLKKVSAQVRNESGVPKTVGVYIDAIPPGGASDPYGCLPNGRILQTTVALNTGGQTHVYADTGTGGDGFVEFSCTDHAGAVGKTYTLVAVADVNADDLGACGAGALQSDACVSALADDDTDDTDNLAIRYAPRVQSP